MLVREVRLVYLEAGRGSSDESVLEESSSRALTLEQGGVIAGRDMRRRYVRLLAGG